MQHSPGRSLISAALFAATIFVSAILLFSVQPILAKLLLPLLGGTPAVWTTCMVFFQGMLLAGYVYAHLVSKWLRPLTQCALHLAVLALAALPLPLGIPETPIRSLDDEVNPAVWLLLCLLRNAGLPFFVISTSAPLLQRWFSLTRHPAAGDPYFLYAASNLGSLIALLSYPLLLEPNLRLQTQGRVWAAGYGVLAVLILACAFIHWRQHEATGAGRGQDSVSGTISSAGDPPSLLTWNQRLRWVALAFVPSSLMLGVTAYLTADVASIPLLWVLPLSLYLLTYVLAFAKRPLWPARFLSRALPVGAVGLAYLLLAEATEPAWLLIVLHLVFFFVAAAVCHGSLASERPPPSCLTEFYLWIAVGGVLGGLFNAMLAPNFFNRVIEYPIALVLACLLRPSEKPARASRNQLVLDWAFPLILGLIAVALALLIPRVQDLPAPVRSALIFGIPLIAAYTFVDRALRFGLGLCAVLLASAFSSGGHGLTLHGERNFFGTLRVTQDPNGAFRRLVHGNTVHGRQFIDPARQDEPLSYYHRSGPLGQVFRVFDSKAASTNVAVIGLGAGSMACYAKPHQTWTYYEINPAVIRLAQDTNYFTFLSNNRAAESRMVLGDARLRIREAPDAAYDLLLLDAFSSDAIPVHLITQEALALYLSKLADGGLMAFHISNRCLDLQPILGDLAGSAGLVCYAHDEIEPSPDEIAGGKEQSHWVVIARRRDDLGRLVKDSRWHRVAPRAEARVWTDDFSDIISVFKWR